MSKSFRLGENVKLNTTINDLASGIRVFADVLNPMNTIISTIELTELEDGRFSDTSFAMPNLEYIFIQYRSTESDGTTLSFYGASEEIIQRDISSEILSTGSFGGGGSESACEIDVELCLDTEDIEVIVKDDSDKIIIELECVCS